MIIFLQVLAAIAITAVIILIYDHKEEKQELEEKRAANRAHTIELFINNKM